MEMDGGVGVVEEVEEKEKKKEGKTEKEMKEEEINEDEKGEDKRKEKRRRGQMKGEMARRKRQGKKKKNKKIRYCSRHSSPPRRLPSLVADDSHLEVGIFTVHFSFIFNKNFWLGAARGIWKDLLLPVSVWPEGHANLCNQKSRLDYEKRGRCDGHAEKRCLSGVFQ